MSATSRSPAFPSTIRDGAFDLIDMASEATFVERCIRVAEPRASVARTAPQATAPVVSPAGCRCACEWCATRARSWPRHQVAPLPTEARLSRL
jgi:hypothetical protein